LFTDYNLAIEWETRIKKWSVKKKEALIHSDWKKLVEEATYKNETTHKNRVSQRNPTSGFPQNRA